MTWKKISISTSDYISFIQQYDPSYQGEDLSSSPFENCNICDTPLKEPYLDELKEIARMTRSQPLTFEQFVSNAKNRMKGFRERFPENFKFINNSKPIFSDAMCFNCGHEIINAHANDKPLGPVLKRLMRLN